MSADCRVCGAAMSDQPIRPYLRALGKLCFEVSHHPELLLPFQQIVAMAPFTLGNLTQCSLNGNHHEQLPAHCTGVHRS